MGLQLIIAIIVMIAVGALSRWSDCPHLIAGGVAVVVMVLLRLLFRGFRDLGSLGHVVIGGILGIVGVALALVTWTVFGPSVIEPLCGGCSSQLLEKVELLEEARAWPAAISLIDKSLEQPANDTCRAHLVQRKCNDLLEWSRDLPLEETRAKLEETVLWADTNSLTDCRRMAEAEMIARAPTPTPQPTPTPKPAPTPPPTYTPPPTPTPPPTYTPPPTNTPTCTPTPTPAPTTLPAGSSAQIMGVDATSSRPVVLVYLQVLDASARPLTWLQATDFQVFDDGQPVLPAVFHFSQSPSPICAALAIDLSGSMSGDPLEAAKRGARTFLSLLADGDYVEIIRFSDKPEVLQGWTSDKLWAGKALDSLTEAGGRTALWDALWQAASDAERCSGRKALIVLTDGGDNNSVRTRDDVVKQAKEAGAGVFVIGLRTPEYDGPALQGLVEEVGGVYTETVKPAEFEKYYREVAGAIRSEYRLALTLSRKPDGRSHRIRIEIGWPDPIVLEQTYQDPSP